MRSLIAFSVCFLVLFTLSTADCKSDGYTELRGEHFLINYRPEVGRNYADRVKMFCETLYSKITHEFRLVRKKPWLWGNRAIIYIAKDKDDYAMVSACASWSGACVSYEEKVIYTYPLPQRIASVLAHELTHIIFREYVGKGDFPLWLDEAIAVYMADKYSTKVYHRAKEATKFIIENRKYFRFSEFNEIDTESLNKKTEEEVNVFYLQSFSIISFLVEVYGKFKFSNFLILLKNGKSLEEALKTAYYGLPSLTDLEREWKRFYRR